MKKIRSMPHWQLSPADGSGKKIGRDKGLRDKREKGDGRAIAYADARKNLYGIRRKDCENGYQKAAKQEQFTEGLEIKASRAVKITAVKKASEIEEMAYLLVE